MTLEELTEKVTRMEEELAYLRQVASHVDNPLKPLFLAKNVGTSGKQWQEQTLDSDGKLVDFEGGRKSDTDGDDSNFPTGTKAVDLSATQLVAEFEHDGHHKYLPLPGDQWVRLRLTSNLGHGSYNARLQQASGTFVVDNTVVASVNSLYADVNNFDDYVAIDMEEADLYALAFAGFQNNRVAAGSNTFVWARKTGIMSNEGTPRPVAEFGSYIPVGAAGTTLLTHPDLVITLNTQTASDGWNKSGYDGVHNSTKGPIQFYVLTGQTGTRLCYRLVTFDATGHLVDVADERAQ